MIEHKTISLADQVFDHLENDILSGKYQRGEILTESTLLKNRERALWLSVLTKRILKIFL